MHLRSIYEIKQRPEGQKRFEVWITGTQELEILEFNTVANTITNKLDTILNFITHRNTNANAESFNAKI